MAIINFYHLTSGDHEKAACQLLEKCYKSNYKVVARACNEEVQESLNKALWIFAQKSFIPHGSKQDPMPAAQPIYITGGPENPNGANVLLLLGTFEGIYEEFDRIFVMFDGTNQLMISQAKEVMTKLGTSQNQVAYYRQTNEGWKRED